jgi:hypothetical protein
MAMQARNLIRPLLVAVALLVAGSAVAQATDKDAATTSKQSRTKAPTAKPAAATKRLDFVPSSNVKETTTRPTAPGANAQSPAKEDWHCDHSAASDA